MKKRYKALIFFASLGIVASVTGALLLEFDLSKYLYNKLRKEEIDNGYYYI